MAGWDTNHLVYDRGADTEGRRLSRQRAGLTSSPTGGSPKLARPPRAGKRVRPEELLVDISYSGLYDKDTKCAASPVGAPGAIVR